MPIRAPGDVRPPPPESRVAPTSSGSAPYTYVGPKGSVLYTEVLSPYVYDPITSLYPRWLHPNAITAGGFVVTCLAFALIAVHSPSLGGEAPSWVYFTSASLFWMYIVFDNTDGKQARRIKASSMAGETFDHGSDMTVATLSMLMIADATQMAPAMIPMQLLASHVPTFINNWYHKITGRMSWGGRYLSVDEATAATTLVILGAGIWGPGIYNQVVVLDGSYNPFRLSDGTTPLFPSTDCSNWGPVTLGDSFAFISWAYAAFDTVIKIFMTFSSVDNIEGSGRTTKDAFTSVLPIIAHVALIISVFYRSSIRANPVGAMLLCGIVFSSMGLRLVLSMKYHPEAKTYRVHTLVWLTAFWATAAIEFLPASTEGLIFHDPTSSKGQLFNDKTTFYVIAVLFATHLLAFFNALQGINEGKPLFWVDPKTSDAGSASDKHKENASRAKMFEMGLGLFLVAIAAYLVNTKLE